MYIYTIVVYRFHGLVAQRLSSKQEITSSILVGALIFNLICRLLSLTPSHLHSNLKFQSN